MRRGVLRLAGAAGVALLATACGAATDSAVPVVDAKSAVASASNSATRSVSAPAVSALPAVTSPAPPPAAEPAKAAVPKAPAPASSAAPGYPVVNPPSGTPWTWPQGTPASCSTSQTGSSGTFYQAILMENAGGTPWNGQSEDNAVCLAYTMGTVDLTAKTAQLLMRDTKDGVQKAFTAHLGDVISLGRFTIKVDPPNSAYGTSVVFEADIYWA